MIYYFTIGPPWTFLAEIYILEGYRPLGKTFMAFKNKNNVMETYNPEEVKKLIEMLNSINAKVEKVKGAEPTRLEKQIRYLEQRLKFFNPTKKMLGYIISQAEHSKIKLAPILLEKLKSEFAKV